MWLTNFICDRLCFLWRMKNLRGELPSVLKSSALYFVWDSIEGVRDKVFLNNKLLLFTQIIIKSH